VGKYRFETDEHVMFRKSLRKFLEKEAVPHYEQWEEDRMIPKSFWRKLGEMGYLSPQVEEQYGGLEVDFRDAVIIGVEMERVGASLTGVGLHNDIVVPYIEVR
jgi:alkylation response protein AidB-like acyl-CoA dehydrogenase